MMKHLKVLLVIATLLMISSIASADISSSVFYDPSSQMVEITCSSLEPSADYSLIILKSDGSSIPALTQANLVMLNLVRASSSGTLSAAFICPTLPDSIVLLGGTFQGQTSPVRLGSIESGEKTLTLPIQLTEIAAESFMDCSFNYVYIGDRVTAIGDRAFKNCTDLQAVYIPASVKAFGADVFSGCESVVIVCEKGSAAEQYAAEQKIPCRVTD